MINVKKRPLLMTVVTSYDSFILFIKRIPCDIVCRVNTVCAANNETTSASATAHATQRLEKYRGKKLSQNSSLPREFCKGPRRAHASVCVYVCVCAAILFCKRRPTEAKLL